MDTALDYVGCATPPFASVSGNNCACVRILKDQDRVDCRTDEMVFEKNWRKKMNVETRIGYCLLLLGGWFFCIAQTKAPSTGARVANLNSVGPFVEPTCTPTPTPTWTTILVIHGGGFWRGSPFPDAADETQNIIDVANDLADAGYYVLVVAYRLAPSGLIPGQTRQDDAHDPNHISGFAPYQEYDVEALVKAARRDPHVRGRKVGIIGGSAGATHAIWASLDTHETD